jgi:CubicO group peptidase (beta-lactamase class C family)
MLRGLFDLAIERHVFPAAALEIGRAGEVLIRQAYGTLTYEPRASRTAIDTIFDLASLTKAIATGPLVMRAVEQGRLTLDDRVADVISCWRGSDRERVTIADLLEHASGLTAYLPFFRDHQGRDEFQRAICSLPLEYVPRTQSIYSDLGFMLLAFILEDVTGLSLAQQFDDFIAQVTAEPLAFGSRTTEDRGNERVAPTELDLWRGRLLQGEAHDENTWALGGAAGHAGLFGTVTAVGAFARAVLLGLLGGDSFASSGTLQRFARKSTVPGSSRALAWDTMLPTSSCGTRLSAHAIGHTGFTGTSLWIDPAQNLYVVLLTNRVHPTRDNKQVQAFRRQLHDEIVGSLLSGRRLTASDHRPTS